MTDIDHAVALLAEVGAVIGASAAVAYGVWKKYVQPWARNVSTRTESTDRAVNGGRMDRVEHSLQRGSDRMDRIEDRIDEHHSQTHDRLSGLENGQREILAALRTAPPTNEPTRKATSQ